MPASEFTGMAALVPTGAAQRKFLTINPQDDVEVVKGLSSPVRLQILHLLRRAGR